MPFSEQRPREFCRASVEALPQGHVGVYGVFGGSMWIYIGTGDVRECLLGHLEGDNLAILSWRPTHFVYELWNEPYLSTRKKKLLEEYHPVCNDR